MESQCPKLKTSLGQTPLDLKTRFREQKDFKGCLNSVYISHWQNLNFKEEKETDTCNIFQMLSKQYLIQTNEHQLKSWHWAQQALLSAVSQVSPRAMSTGGASAACPGGPKTLKYLRDQTQQTSSTLGFTTKSMCCSLWQVYKTHVMWMHLWSTAVPALGEIPSLDMNQTCSCATLFGVPGIIYLIFLKYVQWLEGVGTQCIEAVSTWKHFWSASKAAHCTVIFIPSLAAMTGSARHTSLALPARGPVTLLHMPLALQTTFNRHIVRKLS